MNLPPLTEDLMLKAMLGAWGLLFLVFFIVPGSPSYI
jgi:hypothetical protein